MMIIVPDNKEGINKAVEILQQGGVIVYPTETAYGLGADFLNPKAVKKIYQIKGRDFKKPLPVLVSSLRMAKQYVRFDKKSLELARKYWPGALTIISKLQSPITNQLEINNYNLNKNLKLKNKNFSTLGLRVSSNKVATSLVRRLDRALTATSANVSGQPECYSAEEVIKKFKKRKYQPDLIIDSGRLKKEKPSTIVKIEDGEVMILRQGKVKI